MNYPVGKKVRVSSKHCKDKSDSLCQEDYASDEGLEKFVYFFN